MGKLSKALGLDLDSVEPSGGELDGLGEETETPSGTDGAEVLAMKQFGRASTPEAKVQAMKDFLEAIGLY